MVCICAWCKTVYNEKEPMQDKSETHGICEPCFAKWKEDRECLPQP